MIPTSLYTLLPARATQLGVQYPLMSSLAEYMIGTMSLLNTATVLPSEPVIGCLLAPMTGIDCKTADEVSRVPSLHCNWAAHTTCAPALHADAVQATQSSTTDQFVHKAMQAARLYADCLHKGGPGAYCHHMSNTGLMLHCL